MRNPGAICAIILFTGIGAASAEDSCPDPWANLQGTYKCDGACNYTASVCNLPEYADGVKRWRFTNGQGVSTTGIHVVAGAKTISFATLGGWGFSKASTSDCGATITFDGEPAGAQWKKVDNAPACGAARKKKTR